jgi:hypothetical protein
MTPHLQIFQHDPQRGVWGDCYRTAIACLLDVAPAELPHVHAEVSGDDQDDAIDAWLAPRGLRLIRFAIRWPNSTVEQVCDYASYMRAGRFILGGRSPRGWPHVIIADRTGMVHDVHPSGGGLIGPHATGDWWLTFVAVRV